MRKSMTAITMPERRPGQETITLYLPAELKDSFKRLCLLRGTTMTEEISAFIEDSVKENEEVLKLVEDKLKLKNKKRAD
ncbi:hypothetical protein Cri9333_4884 (plasmid) [Crinalium epipsammum PCC 9333]|uniref:CopG-like ribbon-helix-helix domain-containing protein n=2 Tax=Crinalium TaxID=241421 RepID=K9W7C4_9CYAN|nr:hypothetical protein Cri9333_4884 [Crinalium epipsammum PCC 9333]